MIAPDLPDWMTSLEGLTHDRGEWWMARCPAHDDGRPSLAIGAGEKCWILHCFAGCSIQAICDSLGITMSHLYYDHGEKNGKPIKWKVVGKYVYRDEQGVELYRNIREEAQKDGRTIKRFRQCWRDTAGNGWVYKMDGIRRVPYRLHEIAAHPEWPIVMVEGEKVANKVVLEFRCQEWLASSIQKMPLLNMREVFLKSGFGGRKVAIIPDNDDAGVIHSLTVFSALAGIADLLCYVDLHLLPYEAPKEDAFDLLKREGGKRAIRDAVLAADKYRR